jgi:thiol-disulfide isomerase/thioredoxin
MSTGPAAVVMAIILGVPCAVGAAQTDKPQAPGNPTGSTAQTTGTETMAQGDGEMSVAEAARLAKLNKKDNGATTKKYDDDNFQRSMPIVKKNAQEGAETSDAKGGAANAPAPAANTSLEDFKGKVVLLDFWATWCSPCRDALPKVRQLQSVYSGGDFVVVSISEDDDQNGWKSFVASHGMTWAQRFDGDNTFMKTYQVRALPTYVLLGKDGQEVRRYEGEDPGESIVQRIEPDLRNALAAN